MSRNRNRAERRMAGQPSASARPVNPTLLDPAIRERAQTYARLNGVSTADALVRDRLAAADAQRRPTAVSDGPTRVFGATGPAVLLGEQTYHLALFTTRGILAFQDYITSEAIPAMDGPTVGAQFVGCAMMTHNFEPIRELLGWILAESGVDRDQLPADICDNASPSQIMEAINKFVELSGLNWLEVLVKTYGGRTQSMIVKQFDQALSGVMDHLQFVPPTTGTDDN